MQEDELCCFEELLEILEDIKYGLSDTLDVGEALYCLAKEIETIKNINHLLIKSFQEVYEGKTKTLTQEDLDNWNEILSN